MNLSKNIEEISKVGTILIIFYYKNHKWNGKSGIGVPLNAANTPRWATMNLKMQQNRC